MSQNGENESVCVITGGTSGIGAAAVKLFSAKGFRIATCGRNDHRIDQLKSETLNDTSRHLVAKVDMEDIEQTRQFGQSVLEKLGRVDVLVNNAAVAPLVPFEEIDMSTFEQVINVNLRSTFYLTQQFWRQMKEQGRGVVVNISSLAAIDPFPGFSIYGASKAWLDLMTQALAAEGSECGIRICSIRAGAVETPLLRKLFPDFPADQCVSPETVAQKIWNCVNEPEEFESGKHYVATNQS